MEGVGASQKLYQGARICRGGNRECYLMVQARCAVGKCVLLKRERGPKKKGATGAAKVKDARRGNWCRRRVVKNTGWRRADVTFSKEVTH